MFCSNRRIKGESLQHSLLIGLNQKKKSYGKSKRFAWARYDKDADSVVIYLTGRPQPSVSVLTDHNLYLMVDPKSRNVIGLHVENWERTFVPAHTEVKVVWEQIKQSSLSNQPWNELLRMLALWTIFILKSEKGLSPTLQPA